VDCAAGALPLGEQRRVDAHLGFCAACGEEIAALREVPLTLQATVVPDPSAEFWHRQREAIGRAIRNAPAPRAVWWQTLRLEGWRLEWRRYPLALATSVLVAVAVYHFAASPPLIAPGAPEGQLATLDTDSLLSLRELMQTLVPADDQMPESGTEDDALLAGLPLDTFVPSTGVVAAPQANDLSDGELEKLRTLVGDFG
jgi:anti-sigma factor RsiW